MKDASGLHYRGDHITSSITRPTVKAHNFELKPALISMVQQSQLRGTPMKDSNLHLPVFLEVYDILKLNKGSTDAIRLQLFSFSLRDMAWVWLHPLSLGSITTWGEFSNAFPTKFFPPSKTEITGEQKKTKIEKPNRKTEGKNWLTGSIF